MDTGALSDLRIIEMGQLLAGPFCGQLLGDMGAEIIKIEPPGTGDPMREWGREKSGGRSLWWPVVARNKKSVTINLRHEAGQQLVRELITQADIVIENFRPGTMERWGLGFDTLRKLNPGLVMTRVTGFGQTGPYAAQPGYGAIGEAMGGLRHVVGDADRPPARTGISIGDTMAAIFACFGTLSAVHARARTGRGQIVDAAIYESVLGIMESLIPEYAIAGHIRERTGAILPNVAPSNVYPTRDGFMVLIAANQDSVFARLAEAMQQPALAVDKRYDTHQARGQHQSELDDHIAQWTSLHDATSLEALLIEHAIPTGRILRAPEMMSDPHFAAREAIVRIPHAQFGEIPMQGVFPKLSDTPGKVRWAGPELGEHTDAVLNQLLQRTADEIAALRNQGTI